MKRQRLLYGVIFCLIFSSVYLYKISLKTKLWAISKASTQKEIVLNLVCGIKNFINQYYGDFVPYQIRKNHIEIDKTEYVRNIATMYDIMQLNTHFYGYKKFIHGIDQQVLKTVEENANFYILKYKENWSNMRQASAFLALLLNMISKEKYKNDIKHIVDTLYQEIDDLEPQFELGEVLMALSILEPRKDVLDDQIEKIIKNIESHKPTLNDIFQYNWLSKFILVYKNVGSRKLFAVLYKKVKNVLKLFTFEEETNYLAVAYECLASLLLYDRSITTIDLIETLIEKLIKRHNKIYGLFEFKNGDMRLDITGHVVNGFICMDKII